MNGIIFNQDDKKRLIEIIDHYESCPEASYFSNNYNENIKFIYKLKEILKEGD